MLVKKIEKTEIIELIYLTREFFDIVLKLKLVSRHCFQEKRLLLFGPFVIADMAEIMKSLAIANFEFFMSDADKTAVEAVTAQMVDAFSNTKDKDHVRKRTLAGYKFVETRHAKLGVIVQQAKLKDKNRKTDM